MTQSNIDELFHSSVELYKTGKTSESIKQFDNALKQINDNFDKKEEGVFYYDFRNFYSAVKFLNKLLEINSNDPEILSRKGMVLEILSKYDAAHECLDECLKIEPNNQTALRNNGILFLNTEKFENAIQEFEKVLKINPNDAESLFGKGLSLQMVGKHNDALPCFIQSLNLQQNENKLSEIAFQLIHICGPTITRRYFKETLAKNPNDILALQIQSILSKNSTELKQKLDDLYDKYLHRSCDPLGIRYWKEHIDNGKTWEWVENQIKNSDEAKNYWN